MREATKPPKRVAVFGSSVDLWLIAALMRKSLPSNIEILLFNDSSEIQPATISIRVDDPLLTALEIGVDQLQNTNSASFALGTNLINWRGEGSSHFIGGSGPLPEIDGLAIHQIMLHAATTYEQPDRLAHLYRPFQLPKRAAQEGKMALMSGDPMSPLNLLRPTVQILRSELANIAKDLCDGLAQKSAIPVALTYDPDRSDITTVTFDNGDVIKADFFIDMSGKLASLAPDLKDSDKVSLSSYIPFDRVAFSLSHDQRTDLTMPQMAAFPSALTIDIPLRSGLDQLFLHSAETLVDADIQEIFGREAEQMDLDPEYVVMPWQGNMVRIGRASTVLGPLLSADQMILHRDIVTLMDFFPVQKNMAIEAREFNRKHLSIVEQVADFLATLFHLNDRGEDLWRSVRKENLPKSAKKRLNQFRSRGQLVEFENEQFDPQSWIDLMIDFGVVPERIDPQIQSVDMGQMAQKLRNLSKAFDDAIATMPDSAEFERQRAN